MRDHGVTAQHVQHGLKRIARLDDAGLERVHVAAYDAHCAANGVVFTKHDGCTPSLCMRTRRALLLLRRRSGLLFIGQ